MASPNMDEMFQFSERIENIVYDSYDSLTYLEAILQHCTDTGLEVDVAATLIPPVLKAKIEEQAYKSNMLKDKYNRLPI